MKSIISYSSGGLCNRLLPLASCLAYARRKAIKCIVCWEKTTICHADFHDLFENRDIEIISKNELIDKVDTIFTLNPHDIYQDYSLYGNDSLKKIYENSSIKRFSINFFSDDKYENCCVYSNSFIESIDSIENSIFALKSIKIKKSIQEKIDQFANEISINKDWIAIHARGTDFAHTKLSDYIHLISKIISNDPNAKIFFCSDEPLWEETIKQNFSKNVFYRAKTEHTTPVKQNKGWIDNTFRSTGQVIEALIDVSLLSRCGKIFYNKDSSFGRLASFLI